MHLRILIVSCVVWCLSTSAMAQTPTHPNIHIATAGQHKLMLDLYIPAKTNPPPPLLIYIHGGA